jgi:GNAT superfamily N-acetyltransferase
MLEVREATPADVSAIAEINVRGWQVALRHLLPDEFLDAMDPDEREPFVEEMVRSGHPHHIAVAVEEDRVVGYVMLGPPLTEDLDASRIHEVYSLYIEPDRIGTGLGRKLMDHALEYLRAGGWDYAVLWTLRDAERTSRFYETAGWFLDGAEKVEEIPEGNPMAEVRYRIDLH